MIKRALEQRLLAKLSKDHRAVILYGARQVGKTTLVNRVLEQLPYRVLRLNTDTDRARCAFPSKL